MLPRVLHAQGSIDAGSQQHTRRGKGLAVRVRIDYIPRSRRLGSRWQVYLLEESPGSMETRRWITSTRREPRESATESKPPRAVLNSFQHPG